MSKKHDKRARQILTLDKDYEFWQSDASQLIVEAYEHAIDADSIEEAMATVWAVAKGEYGE